MKRFLAMAFGVAVSSPVFAQSPDHIFTVHERRTSDYAVPFMARSGDPYDTARTQYVNMQAQSYLLVTQNNTQGRVVCTGLKMELQVGADVNAEDRATPVFKFTYDDPLIGKFLRAASGGSAPDIRSYDQPGVLEYGSCQVMNDGFDLGREPRALHVIVDDGYQISVPMQMLLPAFVTSAANDESVKIPEFGQPAGRNVLGASAACAEGTEAGWNPVLAGAKVRDKVRLKSFCQP
jgi:hypothetical protein